MQRTATFFGLGGGGNDSKPQQSPPLPPSKQSPTGPSSPQDRTSSSSSRQQVAHLVALVDAYKQEKEALNDELSVKGETIVSLANALYSTRQELATRTKEVQQRTEQLECFSKEMAQQRELATGTAPKYVALERRLAELEDELSQAHVAATAPLKVEIETLKRQRADDADALRAWKEKVKVALKDGKLREQNLIDERNQLRAELDEQTKKVAAINFQLETAGLRKGKQRVDTWSQTDDAVEQPATSAPTVSRSTRQRRSHVVTIEDPNIGDDSPNLFGSFRAINLGASSPFLGNSAAVSSSNAFQGAQQHPSQQSVVPTVTSALEDSIGAALFAHVFTHSGLSAQWLLNPFECGPTDLTGIKHMLLTNLPALKAPYSAKASAKASSPADAAAAEVVRPRKGSRMDGGDTVPLSIRRRSPQNEKSATAAADAASNANTDASNGLAGFAIVNPAGDFLGKQQVAHYFPMGASRTLSLASTSRQQKLIQTGSMAAIATGKLIDDYAALYAEYRRFMGEATAFIAEMRETLREIALKGARGASALDTNGDSDATSALFDAALEALMSRLSALLPQEPPKPPTKEELGINERDAMFTVLPSTSLDDAASSLLAVAAAAKRSEAGPSPGFNLNASFNGGNASITTAAGNRSFARNSVSFAGGVDGPSLVAGSPTTPYFPNDTFGSSTSPTLRAALPPLPIALPEVDSILRAFCEASQQQQPPYIVAVVRYNTAAGSSIGGQHDPAAGPRSRGGSGVVMDDNDPWTLDTKAQITPQMSVCELLSVCCRRINERHELQLDAADMCFKVFHQPTQQFVTLSPTRRLYSYAYLLRVASPSIGGNANSRSFQGTASPNAATNFGSPPPNNLVLHLQQRNVQREAIHEYLNTCL